MLRRIALAVGVLLAGHAAPAAELTLAANGRSDYQIVVPDASPTPGIGLCLAQVARLVQTAFKANGFDVPVVREGKRDPARPGIYLGDTAFARSKGIDVARIEGWGYVHKAVGRDVIIAGRDHPSPGKAKNPGSPAFDRLGTAKAAADFLRQYAGTRFLYPDLGPRASLKAAASVDLLASPAIEFLPTPSITVPSDLNVQWAARLRYNIAYAAAAGFYDLANNRFPIVDDVFGGHTHVRAIPLDKYREAHPEYFALIGGKRLVAPAGQPQYCISNPAVQELLYQDLVRWLDAGYEAVDLGQPDGFRPCQCEACKKLFATGSDWGEKLWILHRNLAERVLRSHPGKTVAIMSYGHTAAPPKTFKTFPANVRVMLCGTNEEDLAAWRQCTVPKGFTAYLYNWCPNLGSRYTPMRTPRFVEAQARRLAANHIFAINRDGPGALYGLEGPVYYAMGRMFDDPEHSQAKDLVHEFCEAAFGKAAPAMLRFYDQLYHGIEVYSEYLGTRCPGWTYHDIYGRRHKHLSDPFQLLGFLYTPRLLESLGKHLSRAEKAADAAKVKIRLALVRREFDYVQSLARVVHLYHAFQVQPDLPSRDRLLDAIDARNAQIAAYYDGRGRTRRLPRWAFTMFPIPGHNADHLRLAHDGYQGPFKNTCLNWDTEAVRAAPLRAPAQDAVPKRKALEEWRQEYNRKTSEIPPAWRKLPDPLPTPLGPWVFRTDPLERGIKDGWYRTGLNEAEWLPVRVPAFWAETEAAGDYQGHAWYRTAFSVPADWKGRGIRLLFAAVDEQAWVYVNGHLVREHTEKSEGKAFAELWETPFTADVPPEHLRYGKPNVLAVRVHNSAANGGIWRPVLAHALPSR